MKDIVQSLVKQKIHNVAEQMLTATGKFSDIIDRLAKQHVDVTKAKSLLSEVQAKLTEAQAASGEEAHTLIKEAHSLLKELHDEIMNLRKTLKSDNAGIVSGNTPASDNAPAENTAAE